MPTVQSSRKGAAQLATAHPEPTPELPAERSAAATAVPRAAVPEATALDLSPQQVEGAASSEPDEPKLPGQEQTLSRSSADEPEGKSDEQCAEEDPANEGRS